MEPDVRQEERKKAFKSILGPELSSCREDYALKLRKNKRQTDINSKRTFAINELTENLSEEENEKAAIITFKQREPSLGRPEMTLTELLKIIERNLKEERTAYEALLLLRKFLVAPLENAISIHALSEANLIIPALSYLTHTGKIQKEAVWVANAISYSKYPQHIHAIVAAGAIPALTELLKSSDPILIELAVMTLANIATTSQSYRDSLLKLNVCTELVKFQGADLPISCKRAIAFFIRSLLCSFPLASITYVVELFPLILAYLNHKDIGLVEESLFVLSKVTLYPEILQIPDLPTICSLLVQYVKCDVHYIQQMAIITVGNITSIDDSMGVSLVQNGLIDALATALSTQNVKEACWVLSNLAICGEYPISEMIKRNVYEKVMGLTKRGDLSLIREVIWVALNSMILANEEQVRALVKVGLLGRIMELLKIRDATMQYTILDGLNKVLERIRNLRAIELFRELIDEFAGNGWGEILEQLQLHPNPKLSELAACILRNAAMDTEFNVLEDEFYN